MRRLPRALILVLILTGVLVFPLISGCQPEPPPIPTEPAPTPPASPPEDQGDITLLSATAQAEYPSLLTFTVEAESPAEITEVELEYKIDKITTVILTTRITPAFVPARRVKASGTL